MTNFINNKHGRNPQYNAYVKLSCSHHMRLCESEMELCKILKNYARKKIKPKNLLFALETYLMYF